MLVDFNDVLKDCDNKENFILCPGYRNNENIGYFTISRVNRNTIPDKWYVYEFRFDAWGDFYSLEDKVEEDNKFAGTFLTQKPVIMWGDYLRVVGGGGYKFINKEDDEKVREIFLEKKKEIETK